MSKEVFILGLIYDPSEVCNEWVKSLSRVQLFVTPRTSSLPGSFLHGILQARVLEWVAISFSRGSPQPRDWTRVSHIPGRRFNLWATREAHDRGWYMLKKKYTEVGEELEDQM